MNRIVFYLNCCFLFFTGVVQAQETSVKIYDGRTLKVGDTIQAGYRPSIYQYNAIKAMEGNYLRDYRDDLAFSGLKVVGIKDAGRTYNSSVKEVTLTVRELSSGKELYVDINIAIEKGEVIARSAQRLYPGSKFLSDDLLLALTLRVNKLPVTDREILFFIGLKDKDIYQKCRADEFEYNSVKPEYSRMLEDMMNNFDFTAVYHVDNQVVIDKYDFLSNGYPVNFIEYENLGFMKYGDYNFLFHAGDRFRFVPVTLEYGQEVNKRRQGRGSYISSLAYGRFYFRPSENMAEMPKSDIFNMENMYRKTIVGAELVGLEIYDFKHCDYNFIGSIK